MRDLSMNRSHQPSFRWVVEPDGGKGIYDGSFRIARLNEGPYPVALHDLRLVPGGSPVVAENEKMFPLGIAWRNTGLLNVEIDSITVRDKDPSRMELVFMMHDSGLINSRDPEFSSWTSATQQQTALEVTYDETLGSYVLEFRSRLEVRPGREEGIQPGRFASGLEFQDLLPAGCFDRFAPEGGKRFAWFLYRSADGRWYKRPHTHHLGPDKADIRFCRGGWLAYVLDEEHNPVVELLDETADFTSGAICWWAWDFHFLIRDPAAVSAGWTRPIDVSYRVFSLPRERAAALLAEAECDPVLGSPALDSPVFRVGEPNIFSPSDEARRPSDGWFWQSHDGPYVSNFDGDPCCFWDRGPGWQSPGALAIRREEAGRSFWVCNALGKHYPPNFLPGSRFQIEAMVRTSGLEGKAFLGWEFRTRVQGTLVRGTMECSADCLSGDTSWTRVAFETSVCPDFDIAGVYLIQEGRGRTWFDHVSIQPCSL